MKNLKPEEIDKILLVSLSNLGDAVLSLPVLNALRQYFPESRIDVIVGPRARVVFEDRNDIHELIDYERRKSWKERWEFFKVLKKRNYDLVIDLRRTYFSLLGKHHTSLFHKPTMKHKRDCHLETLRAFGIPVDNLRSNHPFSTAMNAKSLRQPLKKGYVAIAPGSKSHIKQWPKEHFATLANRMISEMGYEVFWMGDASDKLLIDEIMSQMTQSSTNLAGKTSWAESVDLIRQAAMLVTNDSSPLHVADHYKTKVLSFFGPTDPEEYGPQYTTHGALFKGKFCSPCKKAQCRHDLECLKEITPDQAYRRAKQILEDEVEHDGFNVLVVRLDRIGDVLLSFPAISAIRQRFPKARITMLTRDYAASIAGRCPDVDDVMVYDYAKGGRHHSLRGYFRLLKEIIRRRFDAAFILHPTFRSHLMTALCGIPHRIGYQVDGGWLLSHSIIDLRHEGYQHESENTMDVVRSFGIPLVSPKIRFELFDDDHEKAQVLLEASGIKRHEAYIVLHPGASCPSKCWDKENFIHLAKQLNDKWGDRIILIGDKRHKDVNEGIQKALGAYAIDLSEKTPLTTLAAILSKSKLFISNDSGPVHLATGVNTKVISIFGRNQSGLSSRRWRPLGPNSRFIQKDVGCVVCLADKCPINFECLKAITPDDVMQIANQMLLTHSTYVEA